MNDLSIVYFRNSSINEEIEIDEFWIKIKKELYNSEPDDSLIRISSRRMHQSAVAGEYAGIFIEIIIAGIPLIESTLSIWEKISDHLENKRKRNKAIRICNLTTLENLCKVDLISNKGIIDAEIFQSKILTNNYDQANDLEHEFIYEGNIDIENAAEIIFKNSNEQFIYTIQTDGNIIEYKRK